MVLCGCQVKMIGSKFQKMLRRLVTRRSQQIRRFSTCCNKVCNKQQNKDKNLFDSVSDFFSGHKEDKTLQNLTNSINKELQTKKEELTKALDEELKSRKEQVTQVVDEEIKRVFNTTAQEEEPKKTFWETAWEYRKGIAIFLTLIVTVLTSSYFFQKETELVLKILQPIFLVLKAMLMTIATIIPHK